MEFNVIVCIYNSFGSHPTLSLIPDFLLGDAGGFGPAITELTVTFHFAHSGRPIASFARSFSEFHTNRSSLPKVVFRRKREKAEIDVASDLIDAKDLELGRDRSMSLSLFMAGLDETITAIELLRNRLTSRDEFDLDSFLAHCNSARSRVPSTEEELVALSVECRKRRAARYAAMSPWETLGLDWRDFHADARTILDDPFFWEGAYEFAPHGNDTGSDLLGDYRTWLRRNPSGDPIEFYYQHLLRWGFPPGPPSELMQTSMDEAAVALAFAEFKLRADCRPRVAALARAAIRRQRQHAEEAVNWPHKEARLKSLEILEAKLPNDEE